MHIHSRNLAKVTAYSSTQMKQTPATALRSFHPRSLLYHTFDIAKHTFDNQIAGVKLRKQGSSKVKNQ
jgi:hypothetical protein